MSLDRRTFLRRSAALGAAGLAGAGVGAEVASGGDAPGTEPASGTPDEMAKTLRDDYARFGELAKRLALNVNCGPNGATRISL